MNLEQWMSVHAVKDAELASRIDGVSRSQISRIRRRKSIPSPETAKKIVAVTGLPLEALVFVERAA